MGIDRETLNQDQIDFFRGHGWVFAPGFLRGSAVEAFTEELRSRPEAPGTHWVYYEDSRTEPGKRIVQRIENFCPFHDRMDELVRNGRLIRAVGQLFGETAVLFKDKINLKLPGGGGFEPHQDQQAGWSAYAPIFLTALVSIDASDEENGCLYIADGPRVTGMIGEVWKPLAPEEMKGLSFRAMPTEPGDVLFFDSYAPHYSLANRTDAARRILYLTYNRESDGDQRERYWADKHASFPPDIEREAGRAYTFRV